MKWVLVLRCTKEMGCPLQRKCVFKKQNVGTTLYRTRLKTWEKCL